MPIQHGGAMRNALVKASAGGDMAARVHLTAAVLDPLWRRMGGLPQIAGA